MGWRERMGPKGSALGEVIIHHSGSNPSPSEESQRIESRWACNAFDCTWEDIKHLRMEIGLQFIRRRYPKDMHHKGVIRCKAFWVWWNECWAFNEIHVREFCDQMRRAEDRYQYKINRYEDCHLAEMNAEIMPTPLLAAINYSVKLHYPK